MRKTKTLVFFFVSFWCIDLPLLAPLWNQNWQRQHTKTKTMTMTKTLVTFVRYRLDYRLILKHRFAFIDSLSYLMVLLKRYKINITYSKYTKNRHTHIQNTQRTGTQSHGRTLTHRQFTPRVTIRNFPLIENGNMETVVLSATFIMPHIFEKS